MAVPADAAGREVIQPDGAKFILHLRGDEFFSWNETEDGYAVIKDEADGFWKYAKPATDRVAFVAVPQARVGSTDPSQLGLEKHAMPDKKRLQDFIEKQRRATMGDPEDLPIPEAVTNNNNAK